MRASVARRGRGSYRRGMAWRLVNMSRLVHRRIWNRPVWRSNGLAFQRRGIRRTGFDTSDAGSTTTSPHKVASQLMAQDALGTQAREELGISEQLHGRPRQPPPHRRQAFTVGAAIPLAIAIAVPSSTFALAVVACSLCSLVVLGALAAPTAEMTPGNPRRIVPGRSGNGRNRQCRQTVSRQPLAAPSFTSNQSSNPM